MSWDTDLLNEHIRDTFDVPFTEQEIRDLSTRGGFAEPDDADDYEDETETIVGVHFDGGLTKEQFKVLHDAYVGPSTKK